jgi:CMD domain protein
MSDAEAKVKPPALDLLNDLVGMAEESPLAKLRAQRAEIAAHIQGSYDALMEPVEEAGVSRAERGLIALRVAYLDDSAPLIAHYRTYVAQQQVEPDLIAAVERMTLAAPISPRLMALLAHVDRLTNAPHSATPAHIAELKRHGLSDANIVTISQLIAFVSFQVRTIVGLQLLGEGM